MTAEQINCLRCRCPDTLSGWRERCFCYRSGMCRFRSLTYRESCILEIATITVWKPILLCIITLQLKKKQSPLTSWTLKTAVSSTHPGSLKGGYHVAKGPPKQTARMEPYCLVTLRWRPPAHGPLSAGGPLIGDLPLSLTSYSGRRLGCVCGPPTRHGCGAVPRCCAGCGRVFTALPCTRPPAGPLRAPLWTRLFSRAVPYEAMF